LNPHLLDHCGTVTAGGSNYSGASKNIQNYSHQHSQVFNDCGSDQTIEIVPGTKTTSAVFLSETEVEKPRDILDESSDHYYLKMGIAVLFVIMLIASAVAWFGFDTNIFRWFIDLF
jgi:hypothetical protein